MVGAPASEPGIGPVGLHSLTTTSVVEGAPTTSTITPISGTTTLLAPAGVFPAGTALSLGAVAFIDGVASAAPPPAGVTLVYGVVAQAVTGAGVTVPGPFAAPVTIDITVLADYLPADATPSMLVLAYWNGSEWLAIPATITAEANGAIRAVARVDHFTMFALVQDPSRRLRTAPTSTAPTTPAPTLPTTGSWSGSVASSGFSIVVWQGTAGASSASAITLLQPRPVAMWSLVPGSQRFLTYVPGAPAVVNDLLTLSAGQIVIVRTGGSTAVPSVSTTSPSSTPAARSGGATSSAGRTYVVTATDTLSEIGDRFDVPWQQIATANGIAGPAYILRPGQVLTIPASPSSAAPSNGASTPSVARTYVVTATDTLSEIGDRFDVPWQQIASANGIAGPAYILRPGQVLTIPTAR